MTVLTSPTWEVEMSNLILVQESLSGVAERVREFLTRPHIREDKMPNWQLILLQSKANGCLCVDADLPQTNWNWPRNTWFQVRLSHHGSAKTRGLSGADRGRH